MHAKKEAKGLNNEPQQKIAARGVRIPIGKSSAKQMIEAGFYADKTDYIAKLFEDDGTYYFFIRPRRFGKSLLLDTIDQIAQGNKALFKTCAIYTDQTYKWQKYPVVWLNFSELVSKEPDLLEEDLKKYFYRVAQTYNIKGKLPHPTGKDSIQSYFLDLFNELMNFPDHKSYAKQPIILIDEYDSPLISCKKEQYDDVLFVLSSFFKVLKGRQKDCKFIFVTGVTKFHLSGLTSGANSANDISLHEDYAAMLGYTDDDVDHLFLSKDIIVNPVLEKLNRNKTQEEKYTLSQVKPALKDYYNGYCFTADKTISVYNPDSILKFFDEKKFGHYWFNRGNPTILASQMKNDIDRFNIDWDKDKFVMSGPSFEYLASGLHQIPILPLMYQTGYLTLDPDGFKEDTREEKNTTDYYLKFPNQEVKSALKLILSDFIAQKQQETGRLYSTSILDSLRNKQWSDFLNYIRSDCLAKAGYRFLDKTEKSFQRALYLFLNGAFHATQSMQTSAESDSGVGRTDIVMEDHRNGKRAVYIFELKIDKPALDALKQIHTKDYSIQYGACSEKVLIGLTCDAAKLNITQAVVEVHQRDEQDNFKDVFRRHFTVGQSGYFKEATSQ